MDGRASVGAAVVTIVDELETEILDRDEAGHWKREAWHSLPEVRHPERLAPYARAFLGSQSLTIMDTRERRIVGGGVTPGEISRAYVRTIMEGATGMLSRKVPWRREALNLTDRRPAYFFVEPMGGPFALVDVSACYATLYSRLTLDVVYRPDTNPPMLGIGRGAFPRRDEWLVAKAPRNALWGNLLRPYVREWRHGVAREDAIPNRLFAPDLTGVVLDAAHAIAQTARGRFGAMSWAVDGGAFRPEEGRAFIAWLGETFALTATIRAEGPGWLWGPTSYSIGGVTTKDVARGAARPWGPSDNLRPMTERTVAWLGSIFAERAS